MSDMITLADTLTRAGLRPATVGAPDGGRLLVLPASGRVLGLYPADSDGNFLWTSPALAGAETARDLFRRDGWPNPGGDRTWLAPEIELFIGDLARPAQTYAVQGSLDPGSWTLASARDGELRLVQASRLRLHRSRREAEVRLEKTLRPAANPLPAARLGYAGYSQRTTLDVLSPADGPVRLGLWNLLQLPPPGTMLVPVRAPAEPRLVFGAFADGELSASPRGVRWRMEPSGPDAKLALKAGALAGRAGYLRHDAASGTADLVVREFTVVPDGDYVDALWEPPHESGWAFQACCVRNGADLFNELEYHAPAAAPAEGRASSRDESRVWAFRGPAGDVREAAGILLGRCALEAWPGGGEGRGDLEPVTTEVMTCRWT